MENPDREIAKHTENLFEEIARGTEKAVQAVNKEEAEAKKEAKKKTFRTWVEVSYRDMTTIKRKLNLPSRATANDKKKNSQILADYIKKTLTDEMETVEERVGDSIDRFIEKLLKTFEITVKLDGKEKMAHEWVGMSIKRTKEAVEEKKKADEQIEILTRANQQLQAKLEAIKVKEKKGEQ